MTDTPAQTSTITLLDRVIGVLMPSNEQVAALLAFEEAIRKIDLITDPALKLDRQVKMAQRNLLLVEHLIVNPDDWDFLMDSMLRRELTWEQFNDIPFMIGNAFAGEGNRAQRRVAARRIKAA
jgi:hypothetical protein